MSKLPSGVGPSWIQISERRQDVLIVSSLRWWVSHWDNGARRSRRCGGFGCAMCAMGYPKQIRFILLCMDSNNRDRLVELREAQRSELERAEAEFGDLCGCRMTIRKESSAKNAAVHVKIHAKEHAVRRDIQRLVDALGLPALSVGGDFNIDSQPHESFPSEEGTRST